MQKMLLTVPALITISPASLLAKPIPSRRLSFSHLHTGEVLSIVYHRGGEYLPEALCKINHFLRDFRCNEERAIDPALLDIIYDLQKAAGNTNGVFEIISGYRSPNTNNMLRKNSSGVAKRSLHMEGKAIDLRLKGTNTKKLRDLSIGLKRGGTGYYAKSDFIHLDTGRVRFW
jgi:uncharacterized protein YcbK (DUF882 family)